MSSEEVIIRFNEVTFAYPRLKNILEEASFSVREGSKVTLMGQNGAGKSTLFKLITKQLQPTDGQLHIKKSMTIAQGLQVVPKEKYEFTVEEFFASAFENPPSDLERQIEAVLKTVNLTTPLDKKIGQFSGGQQARLLLAYPLIQHPDILLLDEPTNILDQAGIDHLTQFLIEYDKTVLVISHDALFLNAFTEGVLYLDSFRGKIEQYSGNYLDAVEQISAQIERERMQNARMEKQIQDRKDKVNFFSNKGGKMRRLASKLRDQIEEAEENQVDVRQEDKTLKPFELKASDFPGPVVKINSVHVFRDHKSVKKKVDLELKKRDRLKIVGPNGIGKSTLLRHLADGTETGAKISDGVVVGYYRQDFSGLDPQATAFQELTKALKEYDNQKVYTVASQFLLHSSILQNQVQTLSEGQKGLLCFAKFVLEKPSLLTLKPAFSNIFFKPYFVYLK
jgi:ATPase subunit of ABC transporter with duplicated ATPase domains